MNIADALSENAGLEGSQWMLTGPPHRALRRELSAMLSAPTKIGPCRLRLARLKPGRRFTASYDVHVGIGGDGHCSVRPIAVNWKLTGEGTRRNATEKITEAEAEAMSRGLMAPFRKLAVGPSSGFFIQVSPLDSAFPQLVRLCDPHYVDEMVASHPAVSEGFPHDAPSQRYSVTPIR